MILVHVHAIPNLQKRCKSLRDPYQGKIAALTFL